LLRDRQRPAGAKTAIAGHHRVPVDSVAIDELRVG